MLILQLQLKKKAAGRATEYHFIRIATRAPDGSHHIILSSVYPSCQFGYLPRNTFMSFLYYKFNIFCKIHGCISQLTHPTMSLSYYQAENDKDRSIQAVKWLSLIK